VDAAHARIVPARAGSVGQELGDRDRGEHALDPRVDLCDRGVREASLGVEIHRGAEPASQQAQEHLALALLNALLSTLLDELFACCHDLVLGFGADRCSTRAYSASGLMWSLTSYLKMPDARARIVPIARWISRPGVR
jgi:hypothetical protein